MNAGDELEACVAEEVVPLRKARQEGAGLGRMGDGPIESHGVVLVPSRDLWEARGKRKKKEKGKRRHEEGARLRQAGDGSS